MYEVEGMATYLLWAGPRSALLLLQPPSFSSTHKLVETYTINISLQGNVVSYNGDVPRNDRHHDQAFSLPLVTLEISNYGLRILILNSVAVVTVVRH